MQIYLANPSKTHQLGVILGQTLAAGSTILLEGDLGAGKTTLVQGIGKGLEVGESIVSPTFTLICEYDRGRVPLYHLDLYRLQPDRVEGLYIENYWEAIEVASGITVIEWAERLPYRPESYLEIKLTYTQAEGRYAELVQCQFDLDMQKAIASQSWD